MSITDSRLSDTQIEDPILRSYLYKDIITAIKNGTITTVEYEIKPDEQYRPDLASYRIYSTVACRWLIMLLCNVSDEEDPLPVASVVAFPDKTYVRERIRHYAEGGGL